MFQFRRFPAYAYLIQRTLHGYCPCGLPHSEISGSMDICSSPKLIAACHVLRRLLMPRHSPCALYSLTCRRCKLHIPRFGLRPKLTHSAAPPLSPKTGFRRGDERTRIRRSLLLQSEKFGSLELCRLHKDFSEIVIVTHLYDVPQLNLRLSRLSA